MTTYNTGNPLGSTDPRDTYDNAENFDNLMNGPADSYPDRLGNARTSWAGLENNFFDLSPSNKFDRVDVMVRRMRSGLAVKIVAFGDSITWGQLDTTGLQSTFNYPARLQSLLQQFYANNLITVVNAGVPGNTVAMMLARMQTDVLDQNPDLVIFNGGTNDSREDNAIQLDTFRENVEEVFTRLGDIPCITMGITPRFKEHMTANGEGQIDFYRKTLRDVSLLRNIRYIDPFKRLFSIYKSRGFSAGQVSSDGSHYSDVGYRLLGDIVFLDGFSNDDLEIKPGQYKDARGQWIITAASESRWGVGSSLDADTLVLEPRARLYLYVEDFQECALVIHATVDNTNGLGQDIKVTHNGIGAGTTVQTYTTSPKLASGNAWYANGWPIVTVKLKPGLNNILLEATTSARIDGFSCLPVEEIFTQEPFWDELGVNAAAAFFGASVYRKSTQAWRELRPGTLVLSNSGTPIEPYFRMVPDADTLTSRWRFRGMFPANSRLQFGQRIGPSQRPGTVYLLHLDGTSAILYVRDQTGTLRVAATVALAVAALGTELKFDFKSTATSWSVWINNTLIYTDDIPMCLGMMFVENLGVAQRLFLNPPIKRNDNATDTGACIAERWFTFSDNKQWITAADNTDKSVTFA